MKEHIYKIRLVLSILILTAIITAVCMIISGGNLANKGMWLSFYIYPVLMVLIVMSAILSLLFGRVFCSLFCPIGILQEITALISQRDYEKQKNLPFKYIIAAGVWGFIFVSPIILLYAKVWAGIAVLVAAVLVLAFFKGRIFCTNICPCGAVLGLISKFALFKMHIDKSECLSCGMCERNCQAGCIDSENQKIDNENCVRCLKCFSHCYKDAIHYSLKLKPDIKFLNKK